MSRICCAVHVPSTFATTSKRSMSIPREHEHAEWSAHVETRAYEGHAPFVTVQTLNMRPSANTIDAVAA